MTTNDWWSRRLNNPPPTQPAPVAQPAAPRFVQSPTPPTRPPAVVEPETLCPSCRSANYMAPAPSVKPRCYDCGYPVVQSSSGVNTLVRPSGEVVETRSEATKQISTANNYNPTTIIGRTDG